MSQNVAYRRIAGSLAFLPRTAVWCKILLPYVKQKVNFTNNAIIIKNEKVTSLFWVFNVAYLPFALAHSNGQHQYATDNTT